MTSSNGLNQPAPLFKGSSKPWFYCTGLEWVCFLSTKHWASSVGAIFPPHAHAGPAQSHSQLSWLLSFSCSCLSFTLDRLVTHPCIRSSFSQLSWAYLFRKSPRLCLLGTLHRGSWATGPPLPLWALSMLWSMPGWQLSLLVNLAVLRDV